MATIGATYYDLIDRYTRVDNKSSNQIAKIIEILAQENAILADAIAVECNQGVSHKSTIRTGLPSLTWGQMYKGITQSKSTTQQVEDATGFLEGLSSIDTRLLDISPNQAAERLSEAEAFLEAFSQEMASQLIYGNVSTDPEKFTGLAPRFSDLNAGNGGQIVDAGGTGSDNTSIWMVEWGGRGANMLYPKGTQGGVKREDMGKQRVLDADGNPYYVMEEKFCWHAGLAVGDWRRVVRIANIDVSELAAGNVDIYKFLRKGFWKWKKHRVRSEGAKMGIYCNSDVLEAMDADTTPTSSTTASYVRLSPTEVDGQEVMGYRSIPVRQVDAILNTEARVT